MQSKKKIIISSVLIGLLAIVVLLSNKGGSNNLTSNAVSKISTEFALPDPEETKKRISELNKEIQAMVI